MDTFSQKAVDVGENYDQNRRLTLYAVASAVSEASKKLLNGNINSKEARNMAYRLASSSSHSENYYKPGINFTQ